VRLDVQGEVVFSQEDALARSISSNICHCLVPALKPPTAAEAPPAVQPSHPHRFDPPRYPPALCGTPPGYGLLTPAGAQ
jgi:hypothetical protein